MQYFIGLGSNIEPEKNIIRMIKALFQWSKRVDVSEIYRFAPQKMDSDQYFLNTVVRIQTPLERQALKAQLVQLEERLGRDRSDPSKKTKDRTADLDIVAVLSQTERQFDIANLEEEEYVIQPLDRLLQFLAFESNMVVADKILNKKELQFGGIKIGEKAVSLYE
ncbi:MAG: 2-amino-4-hydroxy-6-hydroxymethyldihydropteridine diphosphokinase [Bacteroidota bacterium]